MQQLLYIGKSQKGKIPHNWCFWNIKIPKPPCISSLKIIGLLHFWKFLGLSEENYNPQSLWIILYWGEYEGYCLERLSELYKILNTMNHTRTIHCTNKKLSLSKASYPVRRAGQHMAAVHGVATKLRRQNPTKFSPITAILQHSEQFEKMTSSPLVSFDWPPLFGW